jgi:hypothetical protein
MDDMFGFATRALGRRGSSRRSGHRTDPQRRYADEKPP